MRHSFIIPFSTKFHDYFHTLEKCEILLLLLAIIYIGLMSLTRIYRDREKTIENPVYLGASLLFCPLRGLGHYGDD